MLLTKREKSAYQLAWYHATKHRRGIKSRVIKTAQEKRKVQRDRERRRYRLKAESEGRTVRPFQLYFSDEQRKAAMLARSREYKLRHPERRRNSAREWARRNSHKAMERHNERYRNDVLYNLKVKLRRRVGEAIRRGYKGIIKSDTTINLLGCSWPFFKKFIEQKFENGMTWGKVFNGQIHLDHIVPCSRYNMSNPDHQKQCFHFSNLQPLWKRENLIKHDRVVPCQPELPISM